MKGADSRPGRLRGCALAIVIAMACSAIVAPPAHAQPAEHLPRIGFVRIGSPPDPLAEAFLRGLRDLGYVDGRNVIVDYRWAHGDPERIRELTAELVRAKVNVIVTAGEPGAPAAKHATSTIPVVFAVHADPVGAKLVTSLARPGGNVTGLSSFTAELVKKRVELLKAAVPTLSRVAVLRDPRQPETDLRLMESAARALDVRLHVLEIRDIERLEAAVASAKSARVDALINLQSAFFVAHRERIVGAVARARIPAMYHHRAFVDVGGLMSYGPDFNDLYRRAAIYVDKILKGAKPADLPVEEPTKFELVVNLGPAKALGLTIPHALLLRADHVIGE